MKLFPAIDLLDGCAVRLIRGDYEQKTVYSTDPVAVASSFRAAGAEELHLVDLDGARDGSARNFDLIARIIRESGLSVEVGGGIRCEETVNRYLDAGAARVILGTAAVEDPDFLARCAARHGERLAVGADIKDGLVATRGWKTLSGLTAEDFCRQMEGLGIKTVICTDVSRDGMLSGPGTELYRRLCGQFSLRFVASGGVSSLDDLRALDALGLYGAILGKAIYTHSIDLSEAVRVLKGDRT